MTREEIVALRSSYKGSRIFEALCEEHRIPTFFSDIQLLYTARIQSFLGPCPHEGKYYIEDVAFAGCVACEESFNEKTKHITREIEEMHLDLWSFLLASVDVPVHHDTDRTPDA